MSKNHWGNLGKKKSNVNIIKEAEVPTEYVDDFDESSVDDETPNVAVAGELSPNPYISNKLFPDSQSVERSFGSTGFVGHVHDSTVFIIPKDDFVKAQPKDILFDKQVFIIDDDDKYVEKRISEVHNPSDAFKAFTADDGCRYGLDGCFILKRTKK